MKTNWQPGHLSERQRKLCQEAEIWPVANSTKGRAKPVQWERAEAESLMAVAATRPWRDRFFHIAQERLAGARGAELLRRAGVRPGWPDYMLLLPDPRGYFSMAALELKRVGAPPSAVSHHQREVLEMMIECGACVAVCRGWESGMVFLDAYADGRGRHGTRWWEK